MKSQTTDFCSLHRRKAAGHSVGHFAYHGVAPRRALDTFCCPDGFRRCFRPPPLRWRKKVSSRANRLEKSVGNLGLVAFLIREVVIDTLALVGNV